MQTLTFIPEAGDRPREEWSAIVARVKQLCTDIKKANPDRDFVHDIAWPHLKKLIEKYGGRFECMKYFLFHALSFSSGVKPEESEYLDFPGEDSILHFLETVRDGNSVHEIPDIPPEVSMAARYEANHILSDQSAA